MEIYLVRHTKVNVEKGICYGQKDVELIDTYPEELKVLKEKLTDIEFDAFYTSPLSRCKILAQDLYPDLAIEDTRLMELNFGDWEGKAWDEIKDPLLPIWMEDFVNKKCSNGESFVMLHDRVLNFWKELKSKDFQRVIIFTHGGVIRTIQAIANNIKLEDSFNETTPGFGDIVILNSQI
ncbi:alpha-ribazole phosphatase [Ancylomarina longa]|uniref:Alpha-ribazole phosphatase n=1 Tax=Ancylomarina longa TaxID=2487017 RepID=A0A434AYT9_9BACT|nr:alpha-ribazole phosphatase [Ancylomarina longa]RUT79789.1 alpha-ribazole phosphatase [Ancylomarina longa]